ncbi:uncharacterized protein MELLADRAFT_111229 [Melampsora larici-populina 98AG31]|uniref:Uncharacterized protein n=1 Tax=Melampsora larici-populina (strain 98AG31 / pathotype 3-4-7) TaxID=747676 RepID=F4S2G5_MELLP|nr:uncharacterized protein MELLADRAFT_111229 [Melampsora larici-populina 98AG31]EGG01173.1 hypothetical protein MELLADRAFT_111229 [Melampsora larici-populina 98AG31]
MSSTSTLRLRPAPQAEMSRKTTWTKCVAKCHLERERPDFAPSQLQTIAEFEEGASAYLSQVIPKQESDETNVKSKDQPIINHTPTHLEVEQQQEQQLQLQLLQQQQQEVLAEQKRQHEAKQEQEHQLKILQQQQQEEHQRQLYHQQVEDQQHQAQQAQQAQQIQQLLRPPQAQTSCQTRTGTRPPSNASSLGPTPPVMTSTPIAWVVAAAEKIASLRNTAKDPVCPEVEMVDVFLPILVEEDRMDLEHQDGVADDDKMIIDGV